MKSKSVSKGPSRSLISGRWQTFTPPLRKDGRRGPQAFGPFLFARIVPTSRNNPLKICADNLPGKKSPFASHSMSEAGQRSFHKGLPKELRH